jgi:hypothetical protein
MRRSGAVAENPFKALSQSLEDDDDVSDDVEDPNDIPTIPGSSLAVRYETALQSCESMSIESLGIVIDSIIHLTKSDRGAFWAKYLHYDNVHPQV